MIVVEIFWRLPDCRRRFDEVFSRTLDELGGLGGLNLDRINLCDTCTPEKVTEEMEL